MEDADFILLKGLSIVAKGTNKAHPVDYDFTKIGDLRAELKEIFETAAKKKLPLHCQLTAFRYQSTS